MTATREGAPARPARADALACFIDRQRPVTAAEQQAWRFYLTLNRDHMRAARIAFRRVCAGIPASEALIAFVAAAGAVEPETAAEMEQVLEALAAEAPR